MLIITGIESIVDEDVKIAIDPASNAYQLEWRRVSLSTPGELSKALESLKDSSAYDFVAVTRGGVLD